MLRIRYLQAWGILAKQTPNNRIVTDETVKNHTYLVINLGGGFEYFFYLHPYLGKISNFTNNISNGLKPPNS